MTTSIVRAVCPHDCLDTNAMSMIVRDGVATEGCRDPGHSTTSGALCIRKSRYPALAFRKDRLLSSMERIGKKGEGEFAFIRWSEASEAIASRLKESSLYWKVLPPCSYAKQND